MAYYGHTSKTRSQHEDDSPWMDDDDNSDSIRPGPVASTSIAAGPGSGSSTPQQAVSQQEWDKLASRYSDSGYRDGITFGKNSKLQAGFDDGFKFAVPFARRVGLLRGVAASLLAILTTTAGAKHASSFPFPFNGAGAGAADPDPDPDPRYPRSRSRSLSSSKDQLVAELREIVTLLGKLDERKVLPEDEEAKAHTASHDRIGIGADNSFGVSVEMQDREDMTNLEDAINLMGHGKRKSDVVGVDECSRRLEELLARCGLQGVVIPTTEADHEAMTQ